MAECSLVTFLWVLQHCQLRIHSFNWTTRWTIHCTHWGPKEWVVAALTLPDMHLTVDVGIQRPIFNTSLTSTPKIILRLKNGESFVERMHRVHSTVVVWYFIALFHWSDGSNNASVTVKIPVGDRITTVVEQAERRVDAGANFNRHWVGDVAPLQFQFRYFVRIAREWLQVTQQEPSDKLSKGQILSFFEKASLFKALEQKYSHQRPPEEILHRPVFCVCHQTENGVEIRRLVRAGFGGSLERFALVRVQTSTDLFIKLPQIFWATLCDSSQRQKPKLAHSWLVHVLKWSPLILMIRFCFPCAIIIAEHCKATVSGRNGGCDFLETVVAVVEGMFQQKHRSEWLLNHHDFSWLHVSVRYDESSPLFGVRHIARTTETGENIMYRLTKRWQVLMCSFTPAIFWYFQGFNVSVNAFFFQNTLAFFQLIIQVFLHAGQLFSSKVTWLQTIQCSVEAFEGFFCVSQHLETFSLSVVQFVPYVLRIVSSKCSFDIQQCQVGPTLAKESSRPVCEPDGQSTWAIAWSVQNTFCVQFRGFLKFASLKLFVSQIFEFQSICIWLWSSCAVKFHGIVDGWQFHCESCSTSIVLQFGKVAGDFLKFPCRLKLSKNVFVESFEASVVCHLQQKQEKLC